MKLRKGFLSLIAAASMVVTSIGGGLFVAPASTAFAASHDIKIFLSATGYTGKNDVSKFDAFTVDNDGTVTAGAERAGLNWKGGLAGFGTQGYMTLTGSYPKTLPSKMERPAEADGDNKADFKLSLKWMPEEQDDPAFYFINKNGVAITKSNDTITTDDELAVIGDSVDINWFTGEPGSKGVVKVEWGWFNSKTGEWYTQDADGAENEEVQLYKANILTNEIRILDPRLNDTDGDGKGWHGSKSDYTGKDSYDIDSHENDNENADSSVPLMVLYMDGTGNYVTLIEDDFTEIDDQILTRIGWASSDRTVAYLKEVAGAEKGSQEDVFGNRNGSADITAQTEFSLDGGQKWETGKSSKLKIISDAYVSAIKAVVRYNDDKFKLDDIEADTNKGQDEIDTNGDFNDAHVVSPDAPVDLSQNARWSTISLSAKTSSTYQTLPEGTKYRWYVEGKYADRIKLELLEGTSKAKITALASIPAEDPVKVYAYAENEKQFDDRLAESLDSKYVDQYNLFGKNGKGGEVFGIGVQYTAVNLEPCVFVPGGSGSIGTDNGKNYVNVKFSLIEDGKYNMWEQEFTDLKDDDKYVGYEAVPVAGSSVNILGQMGSDKEEVPTKIFFSGTGKMAVRAYYINADGAVVPTDWTEINVKATTIEVPGEPVKEVEIRNVTTPYITFGNGSFDTTVGAPKAVTATGQNLNGAAITYSSSDPTIATVDAKTGIITPIKSGVVTITASATVDGKEYKATKVVTIKAKDEKPADVTGQPKAGQGVSFNSIEYQIDSIYGTNGEVTVKSAPAGTGTFEIPETFTMNVTLSDGSKATYTMKVTKIGKQAFAGTKYSKVKVPASVVQIKAGAFRDMKNLNKLIIANNSDLGFVGKNLLKSSKSGVKVKGIKGSDYEDIRNKIKKSNSSVVFK